MTYRFTSRKFILVALAQIANVALCWFGHIDGTAFAAVSSLTIGSYIAGNVLDTKAAA